MPGGELNLKAIGQENVILNGNPTKTFFSVSYSKYTNFGLQKFRVDYTGLRELRLTEPSTFTFKIPRYADMLMDTYLCVNLPDIWSPIYHPCLSTDNKWVPYEFNWIRDIGTMMIKEITFQCGGQILQKYSGHYLAALIERDFTADKKALFDEMTGNVPEVNDLANCNGRINTYPSTFFMGDTVAIEPSFRSRKLCIPINPWYMFNSKCAFPLIALQYNFLEIVVTLRPVQELFIARDVFDYTNNYPYMQPDFNKAQFQMYRFLQPPPDIYIDPVDYQTKTLNNWNADVHLMITGGFLSENERKKMALERHAYLIKDVFEHRFENITGSTRVKLNSSGMVSNWMWHFQRNDAYMRNQWSNYSNWAYHYLPTNLQHAPQQTYDGRLGPYLQPGIPLTNGEYLHTTTGANTLTEPRSVKQYNTGLFITGRENTENVKNIMLTMGILLDGQYRENTQPVEIYDYLEKYNKTQSFAKRGIYCYNFCLDTNPAEYQPSGAMNMSAFKTVELEITTLQPTVDASNSVFQTLCDENGNTIGVKKQNWRMFDYTYNMTLFEERYNVLSFIGGNCGLLNAR